MDLRQDSRKAHSGPIKPDDADAGRRRPADREEAERKVPLTPAPNKVGETRNNLRRRQEWFRRRTKRDSPER